MSDLFNEKQLIPLGRTSSGNLDILLVVDGSGSVTADNFQKAIKVCLAVSARLAKNSQFGVIQFGSVAKVEFCLSSDVSQLEQKLVGMTQEGGSTNLNAALDCCFTEFGLSKCHKNYKQVWIITDGAVDAKKETALKAQKLKREHQVTIFAIGVGAGVKQSDLNLVTTPSCCFLVDDYNAVFKVVEGGASSADLKIQMEGKIIFPKKVPYKLGEEVFLQVSFENTGNKEIPANSRIIFKDNAYFREKTVMIPSKVTVGKSICVDVKLIPKIKSSKANIDTQIQEIPELLEMSVFDNNSHPIECDILGFNIALEDFSGDVYMYKPLYNVPRVNILTFGPPGAGKSTFVNSVCSTLSDCIKVVNVTGASRQVVTSGVLKFPLHKMPGFEDINFALYDVPGIDGNNYKGDEIDMLMHGMVPTDMEFKDFALKYNHVKGRRTTEEKELLKRIHVVAFFIPQGAIIDQVVMDRLAEVYYQITVKNSRKAIVIISHADELIGDAKEEAVQNVCEKLAIDSTSVFLLENYVNSKNKVFGVDKSILRILVAMVDRADDFLTFDKLNKNKGKNPWGTPTTSKPEKVPTPEKKPIKITPEKEPIKITPEKEPIKNEPNSGTKNNKNIKKNKERCATEDPRKPVNVLDSFFDKLEEPFRTKLRIVCEENAIDDEPTIRGMDSKNWQILNFKIGEIIKINKALENGK